MIETCKKYIDLFRCILGVRQDSECLKYVTKSLSSKNQHYLYKSVIKLYDTDISFLDATKEEFIGSGYGASSLNTYRYLENKYGDKFFEKIYFKDHQEVSRIQEFDRYLKPYLKERGYEVPDILYKIEGRELCIVYYNYLVLNPFNSKIDAFKFNIVLISDLISIPDNIKKEIGFKNYRDEIMFIRRLNKLVKKGIDKKYIEEKMDILGCLKTVITHFDLNKKNVYKNNTVVDWDRFGKTNYGYDIAVNIAFNYPFCTRKGIIDYEYIKETVELYYGEKEDILIQAIIFLVFVFMIDSEYENFVDFNSMIK